MKKNINDVENQIIEQQKTVDFDTREFTIEILVNKYSQDFEEGKNELFVPDYQREFVWDKTCQSRLIESIILGLPIPILFVSENSDGRLEIVDGSQRVRTLASFITNELKLTNLEKLTRCNNMFFKDFDGSRQRKIKNTAIRMIVLSDNTTDSVKNDLFERINRGSNLLFSMEKRKGIHRGEFTNFIYNNCAKLGNLSKLAPLSSAVQNRQEHEELILRFFALHDSYKENFKKINGLAKFLDQYMEEKNKDFSTEEKDKKIKILKETLKFVELKFPNGFLKKEKQPGVSRIFFEAISVGVALALEENPDIMHSNYNIDIQEWLKEKSFSNSVSSRSRTHDPDKIKSRIDFVKNKLLGK